MGPRLRYTDVVRDLDTSARKVWDELYALFQDRNCPNFGGSSVNKNRVKTVLLIGPGSFGWRKPAAQQEKMTIDMTDEVRW